MELKLKDNRGDPIKVESEFWRGKLLLFLGRGDADLIILGEDEAVKLAQFILSR